MRRLENAERLDLGKRAATGGAERVRRDPRELVRLLLSPLAG